MAAGDSVKALQGLADLGSTLVGSASSSTGSGFSSTRTSGTTSEQVKLDQAAIDKIIQDVLGGAEGLAAIFQGEQTAGIFGSSVSAQAAGDLASKLAGEIAKLTAEKVTTSEVKGSASQKQKEDQETEGLLTRLFGSLI